MRVSKSLRPALTSLPPSNIRRFNGSLPPLRMLASLLFAALLLLILPGRPALADEGMWTFDNPPVEAIGQKYGFTVTPEWLEHVRLSCVRFMDGGSGAFISPEGLVVTNHHVALGQLQKMSTAENDYVAGGFYAATRENENPCPDLEVNVLVSMEDVTSRVLAAVEEGMSEAEAVKARDAEQALIEKESLEATGLRSDVVRLYHGGEYWLYRYKKYTDVRLVMAPEEQAAFFGGDWDNFTYPRYCLDFAFFRVYEDGRPLKCEHYLKWNPRGPARDELVFIAGNPGRTSRLLTMAQLEYRRDRTYPRTVETIDGVLAVLDEYAGRGEEERRRATALLRGYANARKAYGGMLAALTDEQLMGKRREAEARFRARVDSRSEWKAAYGPAWERIETVYQDKGDAMDRVALHEIFVRRSGSRLLRLAVTLAHYASEVERPDGERLDGYHDAQLEERRFHLMSPAPIYADMETALIEHAVRTALERLGPEDPLSLVLARLGDPAEAARRLAGETRMADVAFRRQLLEGGQAAIVESEDPLVGLARSVAAVLRSDDDFWKENVESVLAPAEERIARARFAVFGKGAYPDATFTLRLSYGRAEGYPMNGTRAPYKTTLFGLFDRAIGFMGESDFRLPDRFWERREELDLATPVNFCSSCDTIGGNSGSPMFNRRAEIIGINFDRNIEGLSNAFLNDPVRNRNISVHAGYVYEALRKLYGAEGLARELVPGGEE